MKKSTLLALVTLAFFNTAKAQSPADVKTQIDAATAALTKKDYRNVDKSLNQALLALTKLAGKEIVKMFPLELAGLKSSAEKDFLQMGTTIMAPGNLIQRNYTNAEGSKKVAIKVQPYAPELNSIMAMIANPGGLRNEERLTEKVLNVSGRKALLRINADLKQGEVFIVSGNTLYSIESSGADFTEQELVAMAAKIEIGKMETLLR